MRRPALLLGVLVLAGCGGESSDPEAVRLPFTPSGEEPAEAAERATPTRPLPDRTGDRADRRCARAPAAARCTASACARSSARRRVLGVTARRAGWLAVVAPERKNGRVGWIPERRVRLASTNFSVHVDRSARRLTLRRAGRRVRAFPVAVGRPGHGDPDRPLRGHGQAPPRRPRLPLRLLRARALRPPDEADRRLAGRRPARDPRDPEPRDGRARPPRSAACGRIRGTSGG